MAAIEDLKRAGATIVDPARVELADGAARRRAPASAAASSTTSTATSRPRGIACRCTRSRRSSARGGSIRRSRRGCARRRRARRTDPTRRRARRKRSTATRSAPRWRRRWTTNKLDAFVYPTWSNPPRLIGDLNTPHGDNSQVFSPTTGWPAINVPMGYTRGTLPAGMTFFGRAWSEATLIKFAYAYEQATRHRHPPAVGAAACVRSRSARLAAAAGELRPASAWRRRVSCGTWPSSRCISISWPRWCISCSFGPSSISKRVLLRRLHRRRERHDARQRGFVEALEERGERLAVLGQRADRSRPSCASAAPAPPAPAACASPKNAKSSCAHLLAVHVDLPHRADRQVREHLAARSSRPGVALKPYLSSGISSAIARVFLRTVRKLSARCLRSVVSHAVSVRSMDNRASVACGPRDCSRKLPSPAASPTST